MTEANFFFVGSKNPVKVNSVLEAVQGQWPDAVVKGFDVPSGVGAQPSTDEETKLGAANRARAALKAGLAELGGQLPAGKISLGLGLEGGIVDDFLGSPKEMWSTVWVVLVDQAGNEFASNGARFPVPEIVAERIRQGEEMGLAASALSGIENVKHKGGLIGILTDNFTDRTEEYSAIAKMTVGLWFGRHWQKKVGSSII